MTPKTVFMAALRSRCGHYIFALRFLLLLSFFLGWMHQDATWYGCRPQRRGLCVRWRPSPPSQKGGRAPPQFLAYVYCGQTAGCMKMPPGTEVGLSAGDIELDDTYR